MKVKIHKNPKKFNEMRLEIVGSQGWMLAIKHSLENNKGGSGLSEEVLNFLNGACTEANIDLEKY